MPPHPDDLKPLTDFDKQTAHDLLSNKLRFTDGEQLEKNVAQALSEARRDGAKAALRMIERVMTGEPCAPVVEFEIDLLRKRIVKFPYILAEPELLEESEEAADD